MTRRGGRQGPSPEDLALWENVSKSVAPLKRRPKPASERQEGPKPPAEPRAKPVPPAAQPLKVAPRPPPSPEPPALVPLDRRMRSRVARGALAIDARIDLHGLTQAAAHRRLLKFISEAQAAGAKLLLVITGKGRAGDQQLMGEERGVLKRLVPIWLGSEEMRPLVIGFETAGRSHGGEGALYVRVRSRRKAGA
jgi:DNA-nicking Smr family endonuclease